MKPVYSVALLATLAACGGTSISEKVVLGSTEFAEPVSALTTTAAVYDPVSDASFGDLLNGVRLENGAGEVTYNSQLNQAAQLHADDMLANNYFSHTGLSDGSGVGDRVSRTGYVYRKVGENIAAGYQTESSVLDGWVSSPGHQLNNIDPEFEEFGLGYARDGSDTRWVLVLGTPG